MVLCWEGFQVIRNENKVSKAFTPQNRENISDSGAVASTDHTRTVFSPVIVQQTIPNASIMANSVEKGHKVDKFDFIMSGLGALLLLFLTGAPKKGETARICLFILPFLLIPVLYFLTKAQISRKEKVILLLVVVGQAILMQIFANYIW